MKKVVALSLLLVFSGVSALSARVNKFSENYNFAGETYTPQNQYRKGRN